MVIAWVLFLAVTAAFWLWFALMPGYRATFRNTVEPVPAETAHLPPVTVIVPARNEAEMLPHTIPSIRRQEHPALQVILIDDQSDDASPQVLAKLQEDFPDLQVIHGTDRPNGWLGKNWAVQQGFLVAKTEWLLFTDADCTYHPAAVRCAQQLMLDKGLDVLSLCPRPTFGQFIEAIGVTGLVTALTMIIPLSKANDPRYPKVALAAGGFILVRRAAYEKIGGHTAVRAHIAEDLAISRLLKASGAKIEIRLTGDLVTSRMYDGFADLWEGLSKNAFAGGF